MCGRVRVMCGRVRMMFLTLSLPIPQSLVVGKEKLQLVRVEK